MQLQDIPYEKLTDADGNITQVWRDWLSRLAQNLQTALSIDGVELPEAVSADLPTIAAQATTKNILYATDINKMVVNINGTFQQVTTTSL